MGQLKRSIHILDQRCSLQVESMEAYTAIGGFRGAGGIKGAMVPQDARSRPLPC